MNFYDAMNEVLEMRRYDFLTERRVDIRELIFEFIYRVLNWFFDNVNISMPYGGVQHVNLVATIFSVVAVIIVAIAAFVLIRSWLRSRVPQEHTLDDIFEELRTHTVAELLELSKNSPNLRTSVRFKYIAAILYLNERDIIEIKPSATNAIILRQIRSAAPKLSAPFSQIAHAFHLAWFGHKDLSGDELETLSTAVSEVIPHAK
ncbi:MAG: DUF4129 domain-containing protein [Defluviitaleaceae bacterium]|nr:DUF4129 domain-containing protein [Defluviitaleaceae bacterium]